MFGTKPIQAWVFLLRFYCTGDFTLKQENLWDFDRFLSNTFNGTRDAQQSTMLMECDGSLGPCDIRRIASAGSAWRAA